MSPSRILYVPEHHCRDAAPSLTDRLEALFRRNPGVWFDGLNLGGIAGAYAWRSRVSDLRKRGMNIENRLSRQGRFTSSFYRWVP